MKYDILVDFPGSQNGTATEHFKAGMQVELSESLAEVVVREGWARPAGVPPAEIENKAVVSDGGHPTMRRGVKK